MKRFLVASVIVGIFGVLPLASAGATTGTEMKFQPRIGHIFGMIAPSNGQLSNAAPASGSLYYNGGPIMSQNKSYTIFWQPSGYSFPSGYINNINQYFKDLQATQGSNTNTYDNATQYYQENSDGTKTYVQNKVSLAGTTIDTDPLPALDPVNCPDTPVAAAGGANGNQSTTAGCVTDAQMQQEISSVIKAKGWPVDNNSEFFVFTAPNIGTCFPATEGASQSGVGTQVTVPLCSFSYFCAYHSSYFDSTINANSQIIYANMPYDAQTAGNPVTCDVGDYPNGNPSDPEISATSHEQNESMTDPFGTGWWDSNSNDSAAGYEDGDMCAYDFGKTTGPANAEWSQTINGHHYLMQTEWDNSTDSCPGSDSSGNPTGKPNYDTPELFLTPNAGFGGAPFKLTGQFFAAGDTVSSTFADAGVTTALGTAAVTSTGHFTELTKVPTKAKAGNATVTSAGHSGKASSTFTVPK